MLCSVFPGAMDWSAVCDCGISNHTHCNFYACTCMRSFLISFVTCTMILIMSIFGINWLLHSDIPFNLGILCQYLSCHFCLNGSCLPSTCNSHAVLNKPQECFTCPNKLSNLSLIMRSMSLSYRYAIFSLDLIVATSFGMTMKIYLIMAHCVLQELNVLWNDFSTSRKAM